jgi:hypothetical protein
MLGYWRYSIDEMDIYSDHNRKSNVHPWKNFTVRFWNVVTYKLLSTYYRSLQSDKWETARCQTIPLPVRVLNVESQIVTRKCSHFYVGHDSH